LAGIIGLLTSIMNQTPGSAHLNFTLGALVAAGGVAGYVRSRSSPSLIAGLALGALYGASGYLISQGQAENGHLLGAATSGLLTLAMGNRFRKTRSLMPAGLLTGLGLAGAVYNSSKFAEYK